MILLLFAAIVFIFLALGSLVFVACVLVPPTRKYALSAALWCAVWGPCSVGLMTLAGLGLVASAFITKAGDMQSFHGPRLLAAFGWALGWWMMWKEVAHYGLLWWCTGMLVLVAAFATAAYKSARQLRGKAPTSLTWISPDEFAGTDRL
jgi:hypothetical protein